MNHFPKEAGQLWLQRFKRRSAGETERNEHLSQEKLRKIERHSERDGGRGPKAAQVLISFIKQELRNVIKATRIVAGAATASSSALRRPASQGVARSGGVSGREVHGFQQVDPLLIELHRYLSAPLSTLSDAAAADGSPRAAQPSPAQPGTKTKGGTAPVSLRTPSHPPSAAGPKLKRLSDGRSHPINALISASTKFP